MKKWVFGSLIALGVTLVIALLSLLIKVGISQYSIDFYDAPSEDRMYALRSGSDYYFIALTHDGQLILNQIYNDGEQKMMIHKAFSISGSTYATHVIGPYYLLGDSLSSLSRTVRGTVPLKAHLVLKEYELYHCSTSSEDAVGDTFDDILYLSDENVIFGGNTCVRVDVVPTRIAEVIEEANLQ